ncbi:cytochrome c oxidase subunit II [Ahrensia marina]|uniref:Cytochrome c oxidase subunit 2 n=1 Tax=Ahrensia marina TaxID=1514904 RepID=A0A0M9GMC4_9HYPH|nr:cytochrome C oxidase subunit II [Ahrensia marina]
MFNSTTRRAALALTSLAGVFAPVAALADQPQPWQYRFQEPATDIMREIIWFEEYTLWFIIPITLLVLALLVYVIVKFSAKANPVPSRTSHHTMIEVVWTVAPVIILLFLAVPSFQLLERQFTPPSEAELTIKATGYQWYWGYEYQVGETEEDAISFDAILLPEEGRPAEKEDRSVYPRLLAVDNEVVVPVNTTVRILVTAGDVLHNWAMPAFGIKMDAVPGRLNETWFNVDKEGLYYGQCSELCGKDHAYMPIAVRVVSKADYEAWAGTAQASVEEANKNLMASIDAKNKLASAE